MDTAREIDCAIRELVERAFSRAVSALEANRDVLVEGAEMLQSRETLAEPDLKDLFGHVRREVPAAADAPGRGGK